MTTTQDRNHAMHYTGMRELLATFEPRALRHAIMDALYGARRS